MFHVELRQFPHQTRAFNLTRDELDARVLRPWTAGEPVALNDRRWSPDRATLAIYEGPLLGVAEMGLGRGWANVTRSGEDVTRRVLAETERLLAEARGGTEGLPSADDFKAEIAARSAAGAIPVAGLVELAGEWYPGSRVSERIALCERVLWELLHSVPVTLTRDGEPVPAYEWQALLLAWTTWSEGGAEDISLAPL